VDQRTKKRVAEALLKAADALGHQQQEQSNGRVNTKDVLATAYRIAPKKGGYAAVVLDDGSRRQLLYWWEKHVGTPLHSNVLAHHMTLKFNPSADDLSIIPLGEQVVLRVTGWAADDKSQVVRVKAAAKSANAVPHVTVAIAPGVKPVYSNELLQKQVTSVHGPDLTGTIAYVTPKGV
jgi:hypothetical protein